MIRCHKFFLIALFALLPVIFLIGPVQARPPAQTSGPGLSIKLKNRTFIPPPGLDPALQSIAATASSGDRLHVLLQLDHIPSPTERNALVQQGIELQQYVPDNAWVAAVPATQLLGLTATGRGITWVGPWAGNDKLSANAQAQTFPAWATNATGQVQVMVLLHSDVPPATGEALVAARNGVVAGRLTFPPALTVWLEPGQVAGLAAEEAVLWVEEAPPPLSGTNDGARDALNVDIVQSAPYDLDGSGVNVFVFDGGRVDSHPAFSSRLTFVTGDTAATSDHATHVAGTVLGDGVGGSPPGGRDLKGMAPAASLFSAGYQQFLGATLFWDNAGDIETDYASARNIHNVDLGTNSIGSNTAANNFDCAIQGDYGISAALLDGIVRGDNATVGSPVIMTWANGNERTGGTPTGRCGSNFNTTAPPSCAKNPIHIGATNSDGDSMTSFSSWGPCDDGRLKPIISGPGCESGYVNGEFAIYSTDLSSTYSLKCGTSMATPAVAGVVTLGLEHYRDITGSSNARPSNALTKAWLIHTARDQGLTGPDYLYGYGQVDALKFINLISDTTKYRTGAITTTGETDTFTYFIPPGSGELKVSLAWDDYAASPIISNGAAALVNDLDLEVIAPDGSTTSYPFLLDPANPERAATTNGANSLDNQEQVIVSSPTPGLWTIRVKGTSVPQAPQSYALVHSHSGTLNCGADLVTNGDFEAGNSGWSLAGNVTAATVGSAPPGGTGNALLVGGNTTQNNMQEYGYQQVTLPPNATIAKLSFDWFMSTNESSPTIPFDTFYVEAYNTSLTQDLLVGDVRSNAWKANVWHGNDTLDLSPLAGQTVNLLFRSINDSLLTTSFYVDNVNLVTCTENETPAVATLELTKGAALGVISGQPLTYTLSLANLGSTPATTVILTDTVPASTTLNLASLSGDAIASGVTPGSLITWNIAADLAQNQSLSRTFVVTVTAAQSGDQIDNTAFALAANAPLVTDTTTTNIDVDNSDVGLLKVYLPVVVKGKGIR